VAAGGASALLVALASNATVVARAGFFVQGVVWLALLAVAFTAIRRGNVARHARFMIAMAAVASGAIWLRLVVYGAVSAGLPFDPMYAVAAWACWMVPLGLAAFASRALVQNRTAGAMSPSRP
jgi:fatty acid desaturase